MEPRFISLVIPNDRAVKTVIIVRPLISTHTKLGIVYPLGTEKFEPILPTKMSILTGKKISRYGNYCRLSYGVLRDGSVKFFQILISPWKP